MTKTINFQRTYEELERVSVKFWPTELAEKEAALSIIPLLIETQEQFISMIAVEPKDLEGLFLIIQSAALPANLFVRHLMVLSNIGGESLSRISREFGLLFPNGNLSYTWRGKNYSYQFSALPNIQLNNKTLQVEGKKLPTPVPLSNGHKDAIAIMMFGSAYSSDHSETASILSSGNIGDYLGKPDELDPFVKERYIWVSRQTGGEKSNRMGQIAQAYVAEYLKDNLGVPGVTVQTSGRLPNIRNTDPNSGRPASFDLVVSNGQKYVAIEVAFQVTTNSVIERKAGQARDRFPQVNVAGHKIAYVIDGSGWFQ